MTPEQQAVVDRIMGLAYDYRLGKLDGHPYGGPSYNALRTAIEELAQQAAEAQETVGVWRQRAATWEERARAAIASQPLVPAGWKISLDSDAAELLKDTIGSDDCVSEVTLAIGEVADDDSHRATGTEYGLYVYLTEYPGEGAVLLKTLPRPAASPAVQEAPTNSAIRLAGQQPPAEHANDFTAQEAPAAEHAAEPTPAVQGLTDEQIERHTLIAKDCPPDSRVLLVSSVKRLQERAALSAPEQAAQPIFDQLAEMGRNFAEQAAQQADAAPRKSLSASVADALRPFLLDDQKVIWREPFRWFDDSGVMSNHYDGMTLDYLATEFGYEVIHDCGCAGIIRAASKKEG